MIGYWSVVMIEHGLDLTLVLVNALLALCACVVHVWAVVTHASRSRLLNGAVAALAALYVAAYLWLAANLDSRAEWSRWIVGVGMWAWVVVWIVPPIVGARSAHRSIAHLEQVRSEVERTVKAIEREMVDG